MEQKGIRGFAVLTKEDTKVKLETKKEESEEIISRVVAVEDFGCNDDDEDYDDSWSEPEAMGPITTDALNSINPPSTAPVKPQQNVIKRSRTATMSLVTGKTQSQQLTNGVHPPKKKKVKIKQPKAKPRKYKAIGRTITKGDKSYELMFDMLLGIRISVSSVSAKKKTGSMTPKDITEVDNYFVPSAGTIYTPAHPGRDFQFNDYAPKLFRDLREHHGIDSADYLISLTADYVLSEIVSPGKSGSFFYFSHDTKYMLKTITPSEKRFLKKILRAYYQHVMENPDTLIIRFYGFHMVQPHGGPKMHFVVMGNIFAQSLEIQERYDLKGSTLGRTAGEEKLRNLKPTTILKDLDLKRKIALGPEKREILFKQLEADCEFLQRQDIMDYSLLLGIHTKSVAIRNTEELPDEDEYEDDGAYHTIFTKDHGGFGATDENNEPLPEIYFMGIIDILQPYNITKKVEHSWKSNILQLPKLEISAVSPTLYAERFLRFLKAHVCTEDADKIRKNLQREARIVKRKKRAARRESRRVRRERRDLRKQRRVNGETVTEVTESILEESSVDSESIMSKMGSSDISESGYPKPKTVNFPISGEGTSIDKCPESNRSKKELKERSNVSSNEIEIPSIRTDNIVHSNSMNIRSPQSPRSEEEPVEIPDDMAQFTIRLPKRKRVQEKSRSLVHALPKQL